MQKMYALFSTGTGIRATARELGLHRDTVAKYYHERGPTRCQCGKPMTHRGWCSFRVSRSPGRQAFLSSRMTVKASTKSKWLSMTQLQDARTRYAETVARLNTAWQRQIVMRENAALGTERLISLAAEASYTRCVPQIFDDVVQDILVEMLIGNIEAEAVKASPMVSRIINRNYKLLMPASNVSIDAPFGDDGKTYADSLRSDMPLYDEAIAAKG